MGTHNTQENSATVPADVASTEAPSTATTPSANYASDNAHLDDAATTGVNIITPEVCLLEFW